MPLRPISQAEELPAIGIVPVVRQSELSETGSFAAAQDETISSDVFLVGAMIGHFQILDVLGRGGFGVVLKAFDTKLNRNVAIKIPRLARFESAEAADAYLREARTLASLEHPNIVPVYELYNDDGMFCIVSKLIEGTDLKRKLDELRAAEAWMPCREAARSILEISNALIHSHGSGMIHRDIKPGNILLDATGKAYLTDFGLARDEEGLARESALAGTPRYMSPEQARGDAGEVDFRSDIFSLGAVFYELLSSRRPFTAADENGKENTIDLLKLIGDENNSAPPLRDSRANRRRIPKRLEAICLKALCKNPEGRYQIVKELARDLTKFLNGRRYKRTVAIMLALAVAVILGGLISSRYFPRKTVDAPVQKEQHDANVPPGSMQKLVPSVNMENFDRLRIGMARSEVESFLGDGAFIVTEKTKEARINYFKYGGTKDFICISFSSEGKITEAYCQFDGKKKRIPE